MGWGRGLMTTASLGTALPGVALAAGAGVGSYFLFKPDDKGPPSPTAGSIGTVELPLLR